MQSFPVIKISMYSNAVAVISSRVAKRHPCTRSFLKLLNPLSVGALSQQLPLRLIKQVMPYSMRGLIDPPTTSRLNRSSTIARYSQPSSVHRQVMSDVHT